MNKNQFISSMAEECGLSQKKCQDILSIFLNCISKTLQDGDSISFINFGSFSTIQRKERTYINPFTGEEITAPESRSTKFSPAKALKEAVKDAPIDYSNLKEFREASRIAKIALADIKLYHKDLIQKSINEQKMVPELEKILKDARKTYNARIPEEVREEKDYFQEEISKLFKN